MQSLPRRCCTTDDYNKNNKHITEHSTTFSKEEQNEIQRNYNSSNGNIEEDGKAEIKLNNIKIPDTEKYTYLGDGFNSRNTFEELIKTRTNKVQYTIKEILSTCRNEIFKLKKQKLDKNL